jgi:O-antigen/teichoic acid export membrane protein
MMNQIREIYKLVRSKINSDSISELSWVFAGQVTTVVLSFIIVKILSGMGARNYGIYALVITVAVFVSLSFYGPVAQGFLRFYYHYLEKSLSVLFTEVIFKILIISGLALLFLTLLLFVFSPFLNFSESTIFFLIAGIYIIAAKSSEFFNSALNLIRKRKENSILQGMEKALIILLLLVLIYLKILVLVNVFFILALAAALFTIIKLSVFQKYLPAEKKQDQDVVIKARIEMRSRLFQYITPFLIWGFSGWLQLNGEKWIINGLLTTADVGIYAVMMALVNALVIVPNNIISDFATPIIFQQYSDMNNAENISTGFHYIRLNMLIIFMLTIFSTFVTYFWGKELIVLISNKSYTVYWYLLPLLCLGTGLFLTGQAQTVLGMSLNLPRKYLVPKISIGFVSIILNLLSIKYFGINGVAYTIMIIGILYVAYIAFVNKKIKLSFSA